MYVYVLYVLAVAVATPGRCTPGFPVPSSTWLSSHRLRTATCLILRNIMAPSRRLHIAQRRPYLCTLSPKDSKVSIVSIPGAQKFVWKRGPIPHTSGRSFKARPEPLAPPCTQDLPCNGHAFYRLKTDLTTTQNQYQPCNSPKTYRIKNSKPSS